LRAKELNPGDADIYEMLATVHLRRGELAEARAAVDSARELRGDDPAVLRIEAKVLTAEGKHGEAAKVYEAVVAAAPEDAESRLQLARALVRSGRAAEASPLLAALAAELPEEAVVFSEWGGALIEQGMIDGPEGGLARVDRALELGPGLVSAKVRRIKALAALRRCKEAVSDHREVVASEPKAKTQADEALGRCAKKR
jgi:predicted Zn-dependent protease